MLNQSHSILIVDDEPVSLMMLEKALRRKFQVVKAKSGQEALEILKNQRVSLLITDHLMPGMNGTEVLRKGHQINPDMVCMLITAEKDARIFIDAVMNSGAMRVINKPWDADKLLQMVEAALEKYENLLKSKKAINQLEKAIENLDRMAKS